MFGSLKKAARRVGKQVSRSAGKIGGQVKRSAKQIGGVVKGQVGLGDKGGGGDSGATPTQGPQFTDEARRQAAGAGTVGFTQRTQNY